MRDELISSDMLAWYTREVEEREGVLSLEVGELICTMVPHSAIRSKWSPSAK